MDLALTPASTRPSPIPCSTKSSAEFPNECRGGTQSSANSQTFHSKESTKTSNSWKSVQIFEARVFQGKQLARESSAHAALQPLKSSFVPPHYSERACDLIIDMMRMSKSFRARTANRSASESVSIGLGPLSSVKEFARGQRLTRQRLAKIAENTDLPHRPVMCRPVRTDIIGRRPFSETTPAASRPYIYKGSRPWCSARKAVRKLCGRSHGGQTRRSPGAKIPAGKSNRIRRR